ncbi:DUF2846 domain-containing protein [Polymorphobacter sp.]|uniref:DUF2846 domain-containing protein n=1 Tax=Polymorphobacter sp. TaxID=1909290 RepID=UPI003F6FC7FA
MTPMRHAMLACLMMTAPLSAVQAADKGNPVPATLPAPPDGQGQIVFWRSGTVVGGAMGCGVNIGTERISALGAGKYFVLNLAPGAYEFNAKSEAKDVLNLEVDPGETSYVKCTIRMGVMSGRPNLSPSSAEEFGTKRDSLKYVDSDDIGPKVLPDPGKAS